MITVTDATFSAYLYTIDMYESITKALPLPDWLSSEQTKRLALPEEMALGDSDNAAFCVRLMLQRKYFVWGQDLCLRDLLNAAREDGRFDVARIDELTATLDGIRDASFDVAGSEGEVRRGVQRNAEDEMYGALLHADADKLRRIAAVPRDLRIVALAPYIAQREHVLLEFSKVLLDGGVSVLEASHDRAPVVSAGGDGRTRAVKRSSYWSNIIGHDVTVEDLREIASAASPEDNVIWLTGALFFWLLRMKPLDLKRLQEVVSPAVFDDFGDFSLAVRSLSDPQMALSTAVRYPEEGFALLHFYKHASDPFMIDAPQVIPSNDVVQLVLHHEDGSWKVWGVSAPVD